MDDSVQKATTEQLKAQADAALVMLEELKHQPRKEVLEVARAQMISAKASLTVLGSRWTSKRSRLIWTRSP